MERFNLNDRLFIQEILNDLHRNGFVPRGKAETMLTDWSRELRDKTHTRGRTKRLHNAIVGKQNW